MAKVPTLAFVPESYNLSLYAGDGAAVLVTVTNPDETPVDLTGAVAASIRATREATSTDADFTVDPTDAAEGKVVLRLTGDDTEALADFKGVWDVQWTPNGAEPITLLQGKVECGLDVTRA